MDILRYIPHTEAWRREKAELLTALWFRDFTYGHEIPLPDDPKEAQILIDATLSEDAPHVDLTNALEAVEEALKNGPIYQQNVLCIAFDEDGDTSALYV